MLQFSFSPHFQFAYSLVDGSTEAQLANPNANTSINKNLFIMFDFNIT